MAAPPMTLAHADLKAEVEATLVALLAAQCAPPAALAAQGAADIKKCSIYYRGIK